jgi:hypothetical protein
VNGYQQGFRSVPSLGFGGQESASKPPQAICKTLPPIIKNDSAEIKVFNLRVFCGESFICGE